MFTVYIPILAPSRISFRANTCTNDIISSSQSCLCNISIKLENKVYGTSTFLDILCQPFDKISPIM